MKSKFIYIFCFILFANTIYSQEERFFYVDNIFHEIYKKNKIIECITVDVEFRNGKKTGSFMSSRSIFDLEGNLIREYEYYGSDTSTYDLLTYEYDDEHRHKKTTWRTGNYFVDIIEYEYDENGRLIKYCDYSNQNDPQIKLESCTNIYYQNNLISFELDQNGDTLDQYIHKNGKVMVLNNTGVISSIYEDENHIISYSKEMYVRKFNKDHQLLAVQVKGYNGNPISSTTYKYKNKMLKKSITYDEKGKVNSMTKFYYKRK